jgi:small subunit ribosomal protein S5
MTSWKPRTELGKQVMANTITLDEIFASGKKIKEASIVDKLIPGLGTEIIFIGGSPGKGGGIKRTPTRRTARMHRSGRRYRVHAMVAVGNGDGYLGIGAGNAIENRDAIEKATEAAKLTIVPVKRGCGSWECTCGEPHTVPFEVEGKSGSVRVRLIPAPKGIGLCINDEAKKILRLAGVKDVWSKCFGESKSRNNYALAIVDAFKRINMMKIEAKNMPTMEEEIEETVEESESE